jgi:hypothetical protein
MNGSSSPIALDRYHLLEARASARSSDRSNSREDQGAFERRADFFFIPLIRINEGKRGVSIILAFHPRDGGCSHDGIIT